MDPFNCIIPFWQAYYAALVMYVSVALGECSCVGQLLDILSRT